MSVANSNILLKSVTFGSSIDEPVGFAVMEEVDDVEIPAAGQTGSTAVGIVRKRIVIEVEWIGSTTPFASYDGTNPTAANIVATFQTKDGSSTRTVTIPTCVPLSNGVSTATIPFRYRQTFKQQASASSITYT